MVAAIAGQFAGQFAGRSGINSFVADDVLAPEKPYPAGVLDARAAPIFGTRVGLPPVRIHVGTREILLDDSRRLCFAKAIAVERCVWLFVSQRLDGPRARFHPTR